MSKGYWITFYRKIINTQALAAYAKLAVPAVESGGGEGPAYQAAKKLLVGAVERDIRIVQGT